MSYRVYEAQAFVDTHLLMTLLLGEIFEFTVSFPVGDGPENCLIGEYYVSGQEFHGRKTCQKLIAPDAQGAAAQPSFLFFWNDYHREGPAPRGWTGWWVGPTVGGEQTWAFRPGDNARPPATGWLMPRPNLTLRSHWDEDTRDMPLSGCTRAFLRRKRQENMYMRNTKGDPLHSSQGKGCMRTTKGDSPFSSKGKGCMRTTNGDSPHSSKGKGYRCDPSPSSKGKGNHDRRSSPYDRPHDRWSSPYYRW